MHSNLMYKLQNFSKFFCSISQKSIRYHLKRMDDNGNVFLIEKFNEKLCAEGKLAEFNQLSHKQHYFIEEELLNNINIKKKDPQNN